MYPFPKFLEVEKGCIGNKCVKINLPLALREKCLNPEFCWLESGKIWTEKNPYWDTFHKV